MAKTQIDLTQVKGLADIGTLPSFHRWQVDEGQSLPSGTWVPYGDNLDTPLFGGAIVPYSTLMRFRCHLMVGLNTVSPSDVSDFNLAFGIYITSVDGFGAKHRVDSSDNMIYATSSVQYLGADPVNPTALLQAYALTETSEDYDPGLTYEDGVPVTADGVFGNANGVAIMDADILFSYSPNLGEAHPKDGYPSLWMRASVFGPHPEDFVMSGSHIEVYQYYSV